MAKSISLMLFFFGLIACQVFNAQKEDKLITKVSGESKLQLKDTIHRMELKVSPHTFKRNDPDKKGYYTLYNNTENVVLFSSSFIIEKFILNKWINQPLNKTLVFGDINNAVSPRKSEEFPLFLSRFLDDKGLEKGRYRLIKKCWQVNKAEEIFNLVGEFEIE